MHNNINSTVTDFSCLHDNQAIEGSASLHRSEVMCSDTRLQLLSVRTFPVTTERKRRFVLLLLWKNKFEANLNDFQESTVLLPLSSGFDATLENRLRKRNSSQQLWEWTWSPPLVLSGTPYGPPSIPLHLKNFNCCSKKKKQWMLNKVENK